MKPLGESAQREHETPSVWNKHPHINDHSGKLLLT